MEKYETDLVERTLKANTLYSGKIISLNVDDVALPDGRSAKREYVRHSGGAAILAVDGEGYVYLARQYRYACREVVVEIPAGKLEKGESAATAAARELEEEIGIIADEIVPYGVLYPTPGYTDELLHIFLAKGLKNGIKHLDDEEFLNAERLPFAEALRMVLRGEIKDAKTCYAVLRYAYENGIRCD